MSSRCIPTRLLTGSLVAALVSVLVSANPSAGIAQAGAGLVRDVEAPLGVVPGYALPSNLSPGEPFAPSAEVESWTPSTHSVTRNGETTLELFPYPAFRRDSSGWQEIDSTVTVGSGAYAFEALALPNPVHFGTSAESLLVIDTLSGPVTIGLDGASIATPTRSHNVVSYEEVFPGVDLEFRVEGGRVGKYFVLSSPDAQDTFVFSINDPAHTLGEPKAGANESWGFPSNVAFGMGLEFPSPVAWSKAGDAPGLVGSAHQQLRQTASGYELELSLDRTWAHGAKFPVILDPAVQWTDEVWVDDNGLSVAFASTNSERCGGEACTLSDPVDGRILVGNIPITQIGVDTWIYDEFLGYVRADLGALVGRQVTSAQLVSWDFNPYGSPDQYFPATSQQLCSDIVPGDSGVDLAHARCGEIRLAVGATKDQVSEWTIEVTDIVRDVIRGTGPTGSVAGFAVSSSNPVYYGGGQISAPGLRLVYTGYPVPRPLTVDQTFGCDCWAGHSTANQALAADPVNTATGALVEQFEDLSLAGVGQTISFARTYNSLDTREGAFGQGWSWAYGASLDVNQAGEILFTDGSGTRTRFGALADGGYAPIDPAVSASLVDGPDGTRVMRNLQGSTLTFDAAGRLIASADERGQGLLFSYSGELLTLVSDVLGQTLALQWDGSGSDARVVSVTSSDGRTIGYGYANTAGSLRLTSFTNASGATTTYTYASGGGLSSIVDPLGNVSARNTYGADGRITSQRDETGARTTFEWDPATQTATVTDPTGKVRIDIYSGLNLVKQVDGNGDVVEQFYDGDNNPAGSVDGANRLFRYEYDDHDRLVRRIAPAPLNYLESWTYDESDHVASYTDAEGCTTLYAYTSAGLLESVTFPDGGQSSYTYTTHADEVPANLVSTATDQLGRTTTFSYNAVGDLVARTTPGGGTTTFTYSPQHWLTSTTSPSGAVTSYTYDAEGRILTVSDAMGFVNTNTYDILGRLTKSTDALGRATTYGYDRTDRLVWVRDAAGHVTRTTYDGAGRIKTRTDQLGAMTSYEYDNAGRLTSVTDPLGQVTTSTYDSTGRLLSTVDPTGAVTTYGYDVLGRRTSVTDPDGVTETTTYDHRGNPILVANGVGGFQQTSFDEMGRAIEVVDSDGVYSRFVYDLSGQIVARLEPAATSESFQGYVEERTTYSYDADGRLATTVDAMGNFPGANSADFTTVFTYDADGRQVSATDPLGRTVTTAYDPNGRPISVTDAAGNVTTTAYNAVGWITSVTAPGAGRTRYYYDRVGNLTRRLDSMGSQTLYAYDASGQLVSQSDPLGRVTTTSYDLAGNVVQIVRPSGTATLEDSTDGAVSYEYDGANRPTLVAFSDDTASFTYEYSEAGRLLTASRLSGGEVLSSSAYAYDDAGRATSVVRTGVGVSEASYSYTTAGRISGAAWSTGVSVAYGYSSGGDLTSATPTGLGNIPAIDFAYDPAGRLSSVTRGSTSPVTTTFHYDVAGQLASLVHSTSVGVLESYDVTRDSRGNPIQVDNTKSGATTSALYTYDAASRLRSECYPSLGEVCTSKSWRNVYAYDKVGNRVSQTSRVPTGSSVTTSVTVYGYDAAYQLLSESVSGQVAVTNTWTLNGALASSTTAAGTRAYTVDLTDELVSVTLEDGTIVDFTHDIHGNRTSRAVDGLVDAVWSWDEILGLPVRVGEFDASGQLVTAWLPDSSASTGSALAQTTNVSSAWLLGDPFANTVASVSTASGDLSGSRALDAFGRPRGSASGELAEGGLGFASQFLDEVTGLYDMRARDYDPTSGRFAAMDPVAVPTGSPFVAPYVYALNSPLVFVDPSGMTACGPSGSDCNGANLVGVFRDFERANKDAAYLSLYKSLTVEQIGEIPFDALQYIHAESANRQVHLEACLASPGECWEPCPEQSYQACQSQRGAITVAEFGASMALGMGASALISRACAADAAAVATRSVTTQAVNTVDDILPTPQVSSARLQNLIDNLYKGATNPNRVGTGTTMDAIRSEMATGVPTAGRMHTVKGQETLQGLNNWLRRNPDAPYQDRLVAQSLADELARVLGGGS